MLGPDAFDAAWVLATCGWHFVRWKAAGGTQYHARVALLIGQVMTAMECASMAVEEEAATKLGRAVIDLVDALAQPGRFECLGRSIGGQACRVLARAAREVAGAVGSTSCDQLVEMSQRVLGALGRSAVVDENYKNSALLCYEENMCEHCMRQIKRTRSG